MKAPYLFLALLQGCLSPLQKELIVERYPCYINCPHYVVRVFPDQSFEAVYPSKGDTLSGRLSEKEFAGLSKLVQQLPFKDSIQYFGKEIRDLQKSKIQFGTSTMIIYGNRFESKEQRDLFKWIEQHIRDHPK